jgi:hypothetical protein
MERDEAERLAAKAAHLDERDPDRRGLLEKLADWMIERKASRRRKHEREIAKRARRLAY